MRSLGLLGALLLASAAPTGAATISVSFTGTVNDVYPEIAIGHPMVGDPVSISFEIDSTTPDGKPDDPTFGQYEYAVSNFSFDFGGYTGTINSGFRFSASTTTAPASAIGMS